MLLMPGDEKISRFQAHHLIQHFAFLRMCLYPTRYSHSLFVSVPTLTGRHRTADAFRAIDATALIARLRYRLNGEQLTGEQRKRLLTSLSR